MAKNRKQSKGTKDNSGIKVVNIIDYLTICGAITTSFMLPPKWFLLNCLGLMLYFLYRFFCENPGLKKWVFLILSIVFGFCSIYTIHDQSSLVRINVALSDIGKQYYTDDEIYVSDFLVSATKKNGIEVPVETFDVSPTTLKKGKNVFTISYKGLTSNITINAIDSYIEYLEVKCVREKLYVRDIISKKDFNVVGVDSKGNRSILEDYSFAPAEILSEGENKIAFTYEVAEGEITVNALKHEITEIEAEYKGKEALYVGDNIEHENLSVIGIYDNGVREKLNNFSIKNPELTKVGDNVLLIGYRDLTTSVTVVAHGIVSIEAECTNMLLFEGDSISKDDFVVYAVYDTNKKEEVQGVKYSIVRNQDSDDEDSDDENVVVKGDNTVSIQYGDLSTELIIYANESPTGNVSLDDINATFSMEDWDPALDFDINGKRHEKGGKKISISDMWHGIDPRHVSTSNIKATWFVPLIPSQTKAGNTFEGVFILDYSAKSSESTVKISILAGDNEYTFGPLGDQPVPFSINVENMDSMEIILDCTINGEGLVFGILNK